MTDDPALRVRAWLDAPTWLPDAADDLRAVLAELLEYRNAITWETNCLSCSRMLDACRTADERAEKAEAELESIGEMLNRAMTDWTAEATPLHHQLGRITFAAWDPHVDGNAFRELVRAVVGHPLMSRDDATAAAASIRAECRRVGIPVADTAEEQLVRVREVAALDALPGWVRQRLADALDPPPPLCPRCHGRGKIPDFSQGLDPIYGEPKGKPCPDCCTEETPACS
jgi:hypothetical protein